MFLSNDTAITVVIVFLWTCSQCLANIQTIESQFSKGKKVATSYKTLPSYSKIKCAVKCFEEKRQNRCSVAGYNTATHTCFLSNDGLQDLLDADEEFGVILYADSEGMC